MRGSWGRYLPASWTHASVHPDLFTTECLLYLRDGECATRRSLKSGRAMAQQAPRFGAAKCRNVTLPYFQLCSIESRFCRVGARAPPLVRVFRHGFALRGSWLPTEEECDVPWPRFACH